MMKLLKIPFLNSFEDFYLKRENEEISVEQTVYLSTLSELEPPTACSLTEAWV